MLSCARNVLLLSVGCVLLGSVPALAQPAQPQVVEPIANFTPSMDLDYEVFVPLSVSLEEELAPDVRLALPESDIGFLLGAPSVAPGQAPIEQPYVQLIRGRTYAVMYNVFSSLVYKGDRGMLLVDCGGHFGAAERERLLAGLARIGGWDSPNEVGDGLPLKALVITHPHADHCGNSLFLQQRFPNLRIIASRWYDDEVRLNNLPMARPTRKIRTRFGGFFFEGDRFTFNTPVRTAHTSADSYVITPDRVLMSVDIVQSDRLPFVDMSVARDMFGYIQMLRFLAGEAEAGNWEVASWGHFNVGYPRDVEMTLEYLETLFATWTFAFLDNPIEQFLDPDNPLSELNIAVVLRNFFDRMAEEMGFTMAGLPRPSRPGRLWGDTRFFELVRDHSARVHELKFLSFFNSFELEQAAASGDPSAVVALINSRIPDFDPIPPGTNLYPRH